MEPTSLILSALVAGAAKAAGTVAEDTYNGLKGLIKHIFESQGKSSSSSILDTYEEKPETTQALLESVLMETGAVNDEAVIMLAQELLAQLDSLQATEGSFAVNILGGKNQGFIQQNKGNITQSFN